MLARDSSCILPNIIDPFDWFIPSLLDELVQRAALTTSCVVAPRVVSSLPRARHTSGDARTRYQQVRPVQSRCTQGRCTQGSFAERTPMRSNPDYVQSRCTQGSFALKPGICATMLAFFSNSFRPTTSGCGQLVRQVPTWSYGYL
jgi:hypothetical protein